MHGMRGIVVAAAIGVSTVCGWCAEPAPAPLPAPSPSPAPAAATQRSGPKVVISQVSQTPKHEVAISWEASGLPKGATIRVQRAGADRKFRTISRPQPPQSGRFVDEDSKRFNETYLYRLEIQALRAEPVFSEPASLDFTSSRIPPVPSHLQGRFVRINDKHYVELTWGGELGEASGTDHFRLFQQLNQQLVLDPDVTLIRQKTYRHEITRQQDVEVTLGIAAVSSKQVRGEIAAVRVLVPGTFYPAPSELSLRTGQQNTILSWKYEQPSTLAGFRLFHGDTVLLDERQVPADARSATVQLPPGTNAADTLWVQAVSRLGTTSWRVRASGKPDIPASPTARTASPTARAMPSGVEKDDFHPATPPQRINGKPRPGQMPDVWYKGHTPLMAAALEGDAAEVARLIAAGENVNTKCRDGLQETALMMACRSRDRGYEAAKLLVQAGADVNARLRGDGLPVLMFAVRQHSPKCVKLLIDNGADVSLDNGLGQTALDWAREEKDEQMIQLLEQVGAK